MERHEERERERKLEGEGQLAECPKKKQDERQEASRSC